MEQQGFATVFTQKQQEVESLLREYLPRERQEDYQKTIFQAMDYSLMAGGKRIRPILMGETYALFGGADRRVIAPFMAAIEMIHTYSLVHDDLPAMDDDEYRRGRKTTHIVFGEDMGILAGDALLNFAFETAATSFEVAESLPLATKAFQVLSKKSGIYGMVGGQVADVEQTGKPLTKEMLQFIYRLKTGALLEASFMVGGILAGASSQEVSMLEDIGRSVGMAFQIQDDILDCTSTTEELGKPIHSDEKNDKTTYVSLYGLEQAHREVERYSGEAVELLEKLHAGDLFLTELVKQLINRKK
jgi:geranylgeranyl diphosphate synthase type II